MEWHAFANIPAPDEEGFRLAISRAGDWTGDFIDDVPSHVWVKAIPTAGVGNIDRLFKRVVWVATGSGIGPVLPHLLAKEVPAHVVWSTRSPRSTYGDAFVDEILEAEPNATIWDTTEHGRPNLVKLAYEAYNRVLEIERDKWLEIRLRAEDAASKLEAIGEQIKAQREQFRDKYEEKKRKLATGDDLAPGVLKIVKVYLAVKRRIHGEGRIASLIGVEGGHSIDNSIAVLRSLYGDAVAHLEPGHDTHAHQDVFEIAPYQVDYKRFNRQDCQRRAAR